MTDAAAAVLPTAIEPQRVMVLDEDEQHLVTDGLDMLLNATGQPRVVLALRNRLLLGDEFADEMDELARTTLRKRRLETEIKRCNMTIERLTEPVVERLNEIGAKSLTHEGSGTRIQRDDRVDLKYADENWDKDHQAYARQMAGAVMENLGGEFAAFIHATYNANSVGAFFRERYKAALAEQLELPEHERRPVDPDSVIPDELREWLRLSVSPKVKVVKVS